MRLEIYTDGAARGNPGHAASGFVIYDQHGKVVASKAEYIGKTTNNVAEYTALIEALEEAKRAGGKEVLCTSDSKLMVMQLGGKYKVRKGHLKELVVKVKELEKAFVKVEYKHVPREHPKIAQVDAMINEELDRFLAEY